MRKHLKNYFIPHEHNDYKPHSVRTLSLLTVLTVAVVVTLATMVSTSMTARNDNLAAVHAAYLAQLTSEERTDRNLSELREDPRLVRAAEMKAEDMIKNQYFAHVSPNGKQPWSWIAEAGYPYEYAGENLAVDFYDTRKVNRAWMDSPTHRANILNTHYEDIGIAVKTGMYEGKRVAFVVQMFGKQKEVPSVVATPIVAITSQESSPVVEVVINERVLGEAVEVETLEPEVLPVPESEEKITETEEETTTVEIPPEKAPKDMLEDAPFRATHAGEIGEIVLLCAVGLLTISLLLKTFIEMKRQHYRNMLMTLVALAIVAALYITVLLFTGQVTIF